MHIDQLAKAAAAGVDEAGAKAVIFNTITVSDGISMGSEGMRYSLVSREVIADSIETVAGAEGFDGLVAIGGCDKNMPACAMAIARLDRPAVFVYGGTILPGHWRGQPVDIVSVFEAVGQHAAGRITDADLADLEQHACPGAGSCGGMYTANTMASAIEALGLSLPNSSAQAAISAEKLDDCRRAGAAVARLVGRRPDAAANPDAQGLRERDHGGRSRWAAPPTRCCTCWRSPAPPASSSRSTTSPASASACRCSPTCEPSGKYVMAELVRIGGLTPLMKRLLDAGLLHGDALTVTGRTLAENLADAPDYPAGQDVVRGFDAPVKRDSHLVVLRGNLAPEGAVAKISGKEGERFTGPARSSSTARRTPSTPSSPAGSRRGTSWSSATKARRAAPACARCCRRPARSSAAASATRWRSSPTAASRAARTASWSATSPRRPRSAGRSALVKRGDPITIDAVARTVHLDVPARELAARRRAWKPRPAAATRGALAKYARLVSSASDGRGHRRAPRGRRPPGAVRSRPVSRRPGSHPSPGRVGRSLVLLLQV